MIEVKTLRSIAPEEIRRLAGGYVSTFRYSIRKVEAPERTEFVLEENEQRTVEVTLFPGAAGI